MTTEDATYYNKVGNFGVVYVTQLLQEEIIDHVEHGRLRNKITSLLFKKLLKVNFRHISILNLSID